MLPAARSEFGEFCVMEEAQKTRAEHERRGEYAVDVTIDSEYYQSGYEREPAAAIKEKIR